MFRELIALKIVLLQIREMNKIFDYEITDFSCEFMSLKLNKRLLESDCKYDYSIYDIKKLYDQ